MFWFSIVSMVGAITAVAAIAYDWIAYRRRIARLKKLSRLTNIDMKGF
jgi:hypothetical protein